MTKWLQQDAALVRFADDPQLLHWRGILHVTEGDKVVVVTPDRDIEVTELAVGSTYTEVKRYDNSRLPAGVRERDTYMPKHSYEGNIGVDEFRKLVQQGAPLVDGERGRVRVTGKSDPARRYGVPAVVEAEQEGIYLILYRSGAGALGEELTPPADAQKVTLNGKTFAMFAVRDEEFLVQKFLPSEVSRFQSLLQGSGPPAESAERDVRVLPVLFDSADERWRTIPEAATELEEIDYDDFPLQGPRTLCHDVRQLRRLGFDFVQHHESWMKKSGVRQADRSVYEHSAVCRVLNLMVCYDQLNVGALKR